MEHLSNNTNLGTVSVKQAVHNTKSFFSKVQPTRHLPEILTDRNGNQYIASLSLSQIVANSYHEFAKENPNITREEVEQMIQKRGERADGTNAFTNWRNKLGL